MEGKVIYPGSTIGILGGGQLGRMISLEGKRMGYNIICLDPSPDSPCGQVADEQIVASLNDLNAACLLGEKADVVIYEFESISLDLVRKVEEQFYLPQGTDILAVAQNRVQEKTFLQKAGFPIVPFVIVNNQAELEKGIQEIGYPCIVKTATGGYDGKGQFVFNEESDLEDVRDQLDFDKTQWILERRVTLNHELSVIVARNEKESVTYPVCENIHCHNILHKTIIPTKIASDIQSKATEISREIAEYFQLKGLLVVEFFLTPEGLYVNEIAPRPHNSGHYTLDACYVSQFEQLIRAVCGLPLGSTELLTPAIMINILGENFQDIMKHICDFSPNVKVHLYGKKGYTEPKRKVGHLTINTFQESKEDFKLIERIFYFS